MGGGYFRLRTLRKVIPIFLFLIALISVIYLKSSQAKYQVGRVYEDIVTGNVKNDTGDLVILSIYIDDNKVEKIPDGYYDVDEKSACTVNGDKQDIEFSYIDGKLGIVGITKKNTKCTIYLKSSLFKKVKTILGILSISIQEVNLSNCSSLAGIINPSQTVNECNGGNGLYEAKDDYGISYYYRGTVNNNWLKFGQTSDNQDIWWRIIRINGNNTLRLIYAGVGEARDVSHFYDDETLRGYYMTGNGINNAVYFFNSKGNDNAYLGYMYGEANSDSYEKTHENKYASDAKMVIDEWYEQNLADDEAEFIDGSTGFCGDRTLAKDSEGKGYGMLETNYEIRKRLDPYLDSYEPTFNCLNKNDLYTTKNSQNLGNQALNYPIGLIAADEVVYAGTLNVGWAASGSWLHTGQRYYTFSPSFYYGDKTVFYYVTEYGSLWTCNYEWQFYLLPVINLKADINISQGDGTINNPYIVEV